MGTINQHLTSYLIYLHIQTLSFEKLRKYKVISTLNLAPYDAGMFGSGGINPHFSNLCTKGRLVVILLQLHVFLRKVSQMPFL
jgi:hypothetical protein